MPEIRKFITLTSRPVILPEANIDTDQIIPARHLTTTTREGLGVYLFEDWRYTEDGAPRPDFILNEPAAKGRTILVVGDNFGCGSSREHAAWALVDFGFRVIISTRIADIFRNNAVKNGLLPLCVDGQTYEDILNAPDEPITVDLEAQTVHAGKHKPVAFEIEAFARYCLITGQDELGFLLSRQDEIEGFEATRARSNIAV